MSSYAKKAGQPPGTLVYVGKYADVKSRISVLDYNQKECFETVCSEADECFHLKNRETVSWINIDGLNDIDSISAIGQHFELDSLLLEDALNTRHRPKTEDFEKHLFITLKMLSVSKDNKIIIEHLSFVLGDSWVISFQEFEGDIFDGLRQRIRQGKGNIRQKKADYLLYRLVDTIVDHYFFVVEHISEKIEELEDRVLKEPDEECRNDIQTLRKQLINIRKAAFPVREVISKLLNVDAFIFADTHRYLRDVYEHIIHVTDAIETQRDLLGSILDLYLSGVSNKMNQVMKVLTIIATIFIPLTFIAGIYGMNFENMPELHWEYGYLSVWAFMLISLVVMIVFFRRKKWI